MDNANGPLPEYERQQDPLVRHRFVDIYNHHPQRACNFHDEQLAKP